MLNAGHCAARSEEDDLEGARMGDGARHVSEVFLRTARTCDIDVFSDGLLRR
jgi:hypothetical protein